MRRLLSLRYLVPLVLLVTGVVVLAVLSALQLRAALAWAEDRDARRVKDLLGFIVSDLEGANRHGAVPSRANHLPALTRYRNVERALVLGPDGLVAHATAYADLGKTLAQSGFHDWAAEVEATVAQRSVQVLRRGASLVGIAPVAWTLKDGELLPSRQGALLVRYDMSTDIAAARTTALQTAGLSAAAILVLVLMLGLLSQRLIGRNVAALIDAAEAVAATRAEGASGDPAQPLLLEFRQVRTALDRTRQLIQAQMQIVATSEERFRDIVESSSEWIFEVDAAWRFTYSNDALLATLGHSAQDLVGRSLDELVADPAQLDPVRRLVAAGDGFRLVKIALHPGSAGSRVFRLSGTPRAGPGATLRVRCVASDVTEQQHAEQLLVQAQKMEAVGQLAGGVAHDFNNVLTSILSRCELLLLEEDLPEKVRTEVAAVRDHTHSASQLTRRLTGLARREINAPRVLDIDAAIRAALPLLESAAGETVSLFYTGAVDLPPVRMDLGHFEQMLLNFTINARKAMPDGGRISISLERSVSANGVLLRFRDTGVGIPTDALQRVFEPFFTTRALDDGTGLGLASVYASVRGAGGSVSVDSIPGQGACFSVLLPATDQPLPEAAPARSRIRQGTPSATLLVLDDVDELRQPLCEYLRNRGYRVLEAEGLARARQLLDSTSPALVLSDIVLRDGNSVDFFAARSGGPPVLYMSGYAQPEVVGRVQLEAGRNFISKPFRLQDLEEMVQRALRQEAGAPSVDNGAIGTS